MESSVADSSLDRATILLQDIRAANFIAILLQFHGAEGSEPSAGEVWNDGRLTLRGGQIVAQRCHVVLSTYIVFYFAGTRLSRISDCTFMRGNSSPCFRSG